MLLLLEACVIPMIFPTTTTYSNGKFANIDSGSAEKHEFIIVQEKSARGLANNSAAE